MKNQSNTSNDDLMDKVLNKMVENSELTESNLLDLINKLSSLRTELENKRISDEAKARYKAEEEKRIREEEKKVHEEHISPMAPMISTDLPLDWCNVFSGDIKSTGIHVDSSGDGLVMSLSNLGRVDIEYIASVTGKDLKTVISDLKGSIFQNPLTWDECFYMGWETAEEYLSGNIPRKLSDAKNANVKYTGYFRENIEALKKVLPPSMGTDDIYITLGTPWIPTDVIDDFIEYLFGHKYMYNVSYEKSMHGVRHDTETGSWEIPYKSWYSKSVKLTQIYGTDRMNGIYILERILNMQPVVITDEVVCPTSKSGKKRIANQSETTVALKKQSKIINEFRNWVWKDESRRRRLQEIFENNFGGTRRRVFDGSFLTFPGMSKDVLLYPYQKNAVARILFTPNTLLAHNVGSGKTYIMIAAGMELKRMGLSQKSMYVVPNNITHQWKNIFSTMYPKANLLCIEPKMFTPSKREGILEKIRDEDFDAVIIAASCFEKIPVSKQFLLNQIKEETEKIRSILSDAYKSTSQLRKKSNKLYQKQQELIAMVEDLYNVVYFDELGISRLFVDEAHNYKNVSIDTKIKNVLGINPAGSKKCNDMMEKVNIIQKQNNGGGVVFATGTPV